VIQHLSEENRRLKEELEVIKDGKEMGVSEGKSNKCEFASISSVTVTW
jgi:hypothetical protein